MSGKYWGGVTLWALCIITSGMIAITSCDLTTLTLTWVIFLPLFVLLIRRAHHGLRAVAVLSIIVLGVGSVYVWISDVQIGPGASLANAYLCDRNLSGRDLHGADLSGARLERANLKGTNLRQANLEGANLRQADVKGANLRQANLIKANLRNADLTGADLVDADFSGADLTGARVCEADLTGAKLDDVVLKNTDLTGVVGITDDILASVLNVSIDELPCVLSQRDIRLETRESIIKTLEDVCLGRGVDEACAYTPDEDFHPTLLLDNQGEPHDWSDDISIKWEPMALRFCELVIVVEKQEAVEIETCAYILGSPITRYQYHMEVRVYSAKTGELVVSETFVGELPGECPEMAPKEKTTIYGERVSSKVFEEWLADLVNPP